MQLSTWLWHRDVLCTPVEITVDTCGYHTLPLVVGNGKHSINNTSTHKQRLSKNKHVYWVLKAEDGEELGKRKFWLVWVRQWVKWAGGGIYHPPSALSETEKLYIKKYYSGNETKNRQVGHVAHMEVRRDAYNVLVWKPEGKRSLWRPRRRWDNNIKNGSLRNRIGEWADWSAQDTEKWRALVKAVTNIRNP